MKRNHSKAKSAMAMVLALSMTLQQSSVITFAEEQAFLDMQGIEQNDTSEAETDAQESANAGDAGQNSTDAPAVDTAGTVDADQNSGDAPADDAVDVNQNSGDVPTDGAVDTDQNSGDAPVEGAVDADQELPQPASPSDSIDPAETAGEGMPADELNDLNVPDDSLSEMTDESDEPEDTADSDSLTKFIYSGNGISATIFAEQAAELPDDAKFHVEPLAADSQEFAGMDAQIREELGYGDAELDYLPYEMYFTAADSGEKIEPKDGLVSVVLTFDEPVNLGEHDTPVKGTAIAHERENGYESLNAYQDFPQIDYTQTELETEGYGISVNGISFTTTGFSKFAGVVEYEKVREEEEPAEKKLKTRVPLKNAADSGEGTSIEDSPYFAKTFSIEGVVPNAKNIYEVISNESYTIHLGFEENEDETGNRAQFGLGQFQYRVPDDVLILNPVTKESPHTIPVLLGSAGESGEDVRIQAKWWIEDSNKIVLEWDFVSEVEGDSHTEAQKRQAFENCRNTYFELELEGSFKDDAATIVWGPSREDEISVNTNREVLINKVPSKYDPVSNSVLYTISLESVGINTDVKVQDVIAESSRNFLKYNSGTLTINDVTNGTEVFDSGKYSVWETDANGTITLQDGSTIPSDAGFGLTIPKLGNGQKLEITYSVNLANIGSLQTNQGEDGSVYLGTSDQTKNDVSVSTKESKSGYFKETDLVTTKSITAADIVKSNGINAGQSQDGGTFYQRTKWTIGLVSRPEAGLNMGGRTIKDTLNLVTGKHLGDTVYDGPITVTVYDAAKEHVVKTWNVDLKNGEGLTVAEDLHSWEYVIPSEDETIGRKAGSNDGDAFIYEISYHTKTNITDMVEEVSFGNTGEGTGIGSAQGTGTIGPRAQNKFEISKKPVAISRNSKEVTWKIEVDLPATGLSDTTTLTETLPVRTNGDSVYTDQLVRIDSVTCEGTNVNYTCDYTEGDSTALISFFQNEDHTTPGFAAFHDDRTHKLVVTLTTRANDDWVSAFEKSHSDELMIHRNIATFYNNYVSRSAEADVVPYPVMTKDMDQVEDTPVEVDGAVKSMPTYQSEITLYGNALLSSGEQEVSITDTFDDRLMYVEDSAEITYPESARGKAVTVTNDSGNAVTRDDHSIKFTISNDTWQEKEYKYKICYKVRVKEEELGNLITEARTAPDNVVELKNTASAELFGSTEATVDYEHKPIEKQFLNEDEVNASNRKAKFEIEVNKEAEDLDPDSDLLVVPDEYDSSISVDYNSIKVVEFGTGENGENGVVFHDGTAIQRTNNATSYWDAGGNKLVFTIPDGRHVIITYEATVSGWGEVGINNTASVMGQTSSINVVKDFKEKGRAGGSSYGIYIKKFVDGDMTQPLSDVKFYYAEKAVWDQTTDITITELPYKLTGSDGMIFLGGLKRETWYCFQEAADQNQYKESHGAELFDTYRKDPTVYRFKISADGTTVYNDYIYKTKDVLTVRNETKTMSIPVRKLWKNSDGTIIEDGPPARDGSPVKVTFELKRKDGKPVYYAGSDGYPHIAEESKVPPLTVVKGEDGEWKGEFANIPRRELQTDGNDSWEATIQYYVEEVSVANLADGETYVSDGGKRVDDLRENRIDKGYVFTNTKVPDDKGLIQIKKTVADGVTTNDTFAVRISGSDEMNLSGATVQGTSTYSRKAKEIIVYLKADETVTVGNLALDQEYRIQEVIPKGAKYSAAYRDLVNAQESGEAVVAKPTASVSDAENSDSKISKVTVVNTYIPEQIIVVKKEVSGADRVSTHKFYVAIKCEDSGNGTKYLQKDGTLGEEQALFAVSEANPLRLSVPVSSDGSQPYKYTVEEVDYNESMTVQDHTYQQTVITVNAKDADGKTVQQQVFEGKVPAGSEGGSSAADSSSFIEVTQAESKTFTVKNTYETEKGTLRIRKNLEDLNDVKASTSIEKEYEDKVFYVVIQNPDDRYLNGTVEGHVVQNVTLTDEPYVFPVSVKDGLTINNVPVGENEYSVIEVKDDQGQAFDGNLSDLGDGEYLYVRSKYRDLGVTVVKNPKLTDSSEKEVISDSSVTNYYRHKTAKIAVQKEFELDDSTLSGLTDDQRAALLDKLKEAAKNKEFTFKIEQKQPEDKWTVVDQLTVKGDGSLKESKDLPTGEVYRVTEVPVSDDFDEYIYKDGVLSSEGVSGSRAANPEVSFELKDGQANQTVKVTAVNDYVKVKGIQLKAAKILKNGENPGDLTQNHFEFALYERVTAEEKFVSKGTTGTDGTYTFPRIRYKEAGSHTYVIKEIIPQYADHTSGVSNTSYNGIEYDTSTKEVSVEVTGDVTNGFTVKIGDVDYAGLEDTAPYGTGIIFTNKPIKTQIAKQKQDGTEAAVAMAGVRLTLTKTGGGVLDAQGHTSPFTWTTGEKPENASGSYTGADCVMDFYGLRDGTYTLSEQPGTEYYLADVTFTVKNGVITLPENGHPQASVDAILDEGSKLTVTNKPTHFTVKKVDEKGNAMSGVALELYTKDAFEASPRGTTVSGCTWTTDTTGEKTFSKLTTGVEYVLYEKSTGNEKYDTITPFYFKIGTDNSIISTKGNNPQVSIISGTDTNKKDRSAGGENGNQILAQNAKIYGKVTLEKEILDGTNVVTTRTPDVTTKVRDTDRAASVELDRSATFNMYYQKGEAPDSGDGKDPLIATIATGMDGVWSSVNNTATYQNPYDLSEEISFSKGLPTGNYYLIEVESSKSEDMSGVAASKAEKRTIGEADIYYWSFSVRSTDTTGIVHDGSASTSVTASNNLFKASVSLKKIDADVIGGAVLDGVPFKLSKKNGETTFILTGKTDANGELTFSDLPKGTYELEELVNNEQNPGGNEGYDLTGQRHKDHKPFKATITISDEDNGKTLTVTSDNKKISKTEGVWDTNGILNYRSLGSVELTKKGGITDSELLSGVTFTLQKKKETGEGYDDFWTGLSTGYSYAEPTPEQKDELLSSASSDAERYNQAYAKARANSKTTGSAGVLKIENLPWGEYKLVETAGVDGYVRNTYESTGTGKYTPVEVIFTIQRGQPQTTQIYTREAVNQPTRLKIKKTDLGTTNLSGAEFELQGTYWDKTSKKRKTGTLKIGPTDASGEIKLEGVLIAGETYTLTETTAPAGYKLPENGNQVCFTIDENGVISKLYDSAESGKKEITNQGYSSLTSKVGDKDFNVITIKDEPITVTLKKADNSGQSLSGATFRITPDTGSTFADGTREAQVISITDANNPYTLRAKLCLNGVYTVEEITAPFGYQKHASNKQLFKLQVDGKGTVSTTAILSEAEGANGTVVVSAAAPTPTPQAVTNISDLAGTVKDAPLQEISIYKRDKDSFAALQGVEFTLKTTGSGETFANGSTELTLISNEKGELRAIKNAESGTYYTSAEFMKLLHVGYTYTLHEKDYVNFSLYNAISSDMNFTIGNDGKVTVSESSNGGGAMSVDRDQLTITVTNERKLTTVKLTKKDDSNPAVTIPNVEFSLWKRNTSGNDYTKVTDTSHTNSQGNYVTDSNGVLTIPDLGWGQYKLVEEKATGYELPDPTSANAVTIPFAIGADAASITASEVQKYVSATEDNTFVLQDVTNTRNSLTIQKKDRTGSMNLTGVSFRLYRNSVVPENLYASTEADDYSGEESPVRQLSGSASFTLRNIPDGDYILVETKAPEGYEIQSAQKNIRFRMETTGAITWHDENPSADAVLDSASNTITVKDAPISLVIKKEDLSGSAGAAANALSGAVFQLEEIGTEGKVKDGITTGNDGRITLSGTDSSFTLIAGKTYRLTETQAPAGYLLYDPAPRVTFTVNEDGTFEFASAGIPLEVSGQYKITGSGTDTITFSERKTKLVLKKVDNETGAALNGAVLEIYRAEDFNAPAGTDLGSPKAGARPVWTGDRANQTSAGIWTVEGLDAGTNGKEYYLYEKKAPSGYEKFVSFKFKIDPDNQISYSAAGIPSITTSNGISQSVSSQITVSGDGKNTATLTIQAADTRIRGYVTIQKKIVNAMADTKSLANRVPSVSREAQAQSAISLNQAGITFDLYVQNQTANEKIAENLKTDADGTWDYLHPNTDMRWIKTEFSHGLPTGDYYFIETAATEDLYYDASADHKYSFTIGDTGTGAHLAAVEPDVKNVLFHADIRLTKLDWDAVNRGLTPAGMNGVTFTLTGPHADPADSADNTIALTGTTATVDGTDGVLKFSNLPKGTYELTETLPAGYDSTGVRKSAAGDKSEAFKALITVTDADQNSTINVNRTTAQQAVAGDAARNKIQVEAGALNADGILNYRSLGTIKVLKLSGDSTNSNERLNDAVFKLQVKNAGGQFEDYWSALLTGNTYTEYDPAKGQSENDRAQSTNGKEGSHKGILEIRDLPWGTYRLVETRGTDGYGTTDQNGKTVSSDDIADVTNGFVIDADQLSYDFTSDTNGLKNYKNQLTIRKTSLSGTALADAEFTLSRRVMGESGSVWEPVRTGLKTDAQGKITLTGVLISEETYQLHETKAPEGYELITQDIIFTVGTDGKLTVQNGKGFTTDSDQEGYFLPDSANGHYAVTITAKDTPIRVSLEKTDAVTKGLLDDFVFTVKPAEGSHFSTSAGTTDGAVVITKDNRKTALNGVLVAGNTYEITETGVPEGYEKAGKVTFTVDANGDVKNLTGPAAVSAYSPAADGGAEDPESQRITITDNPLTISVAKAELQEAGAQTSTVLRDGANFELVPEVGSRFTRQGSETAAPAKLTFETTGGVPYEISRRLIVGNTYTLRETKSPAGYVLSDPAPGITFTVQEDGTLEYSTSKVKTVSGEGTITVDNTSADGTAAILFTDRQTKLQIRKVDNETGADLRGATLTLYQGALTADGTLGEGASVKAVLTDENRNADGTWTVTGLDAGEASGADTGEASGNGSGETSGTSAGVDYVLIESVTPAGYDTFAPLAFTLYPDNHIQVTSEIRAITTSFALPEYAQEFVLADGGSGKNGGTIGITAVDTRVRGHFNIEKQIDASVTEKNVSSRVPTPAMDTEDKTVALDKSAVFRLYAMTGSEPAESDPCIATITTDAVTGLWKSQTTAGSYQDPEDLTKTHLFKEGLPAGRYYLKEIFSSKDMLYDKTVEDAVYSFEVKADTSAETAGHNSDQKQTITNTLFTAGIEVTKLDRDAIERGEAGKTISGAVFTLKGTDRENSGIQLSATTDADGRAAFANLPKGTYELAEADTLTGYELSGGREKEKSVPFKAVIRITDADQNTDGTHTIRVNAQAEDAQVTIRTFSGSTGTVTTSDTAQITREAGDWNADGVLNYRRLGSVKLVKTDADTNAALNGAVFALQMKTGSTGTDADYKDYLTGLKTGSVYYDRDTASHAADHAGKEGETGILQLNQLPWGTYRLVETQAPDGYDLIEKALEFTLHADGSLDADAVTEENGAGYTAVLEEPYQIRILARDHFRKFPVQVLKVDAGTQKALPGAVMQILDSKGTVFAEWESTGEAHEVPDLIPHEVYTLHEEKAPQGYGTAGETIFVLKDDGSFDLQKTSAKVNRDGVLLVEDGKTGATLSVTKRLVLEESKEELGAVDQTFYVQLFYDEACTVPVSDIKPLNFKNAVASTAVFDVEYGLTYFVQEVTEDGVPIDSGMVDGTLFTASFEEAGNSVTIDEDGDGKASLTFSNEFLSVPEGFFYGRYLTVNKRVRTASGDAKKSDETFYAGIFADAKLTTLSDAVEYPILPLEMGGEAAASAATLVAAMPGTTLTLYIAEVNEDGKPVNEDETFAYTVTIDTDSVTFSDAVDGAEVTITNQEKPEATATPTPAAGSSAGTSRTDGPRTGDDTDLAGTFALLVLSGFWMLTLAMRRSRKYGIMFSTKDRTKDV